MGQRERLENKVALVTGGTSGIGLETARAFAAEGARVFVTGRREAELAAAVRTIGSRATGIQADASKLADLDRVFATIAADAGRLDVVFANAGGGDMLPLGEITEQHFDDIFATNVKGVVFTVQKALPLLREGASVILNGSTASTVGTPAFSIYGASKAAVRALARNWVLDVKGRGIRINTLSPGPTRTPGLLGLAPESAQKGLLAQLASQVPLGRVADPSEIAKVAVFLASDEASFVNGVELFADGGQAQV